MLLKTFCQSPLTSSSKRREVKRACIKWTPIFWIKMKLKRRLWRFGRHCKGPIPCSLLECASSFTSISSTTRDKLKRARWLRKRSTKPRRGRSASQKSTRQWRMSTMSFQMPRLLVVFQNSEIARTTNMSTCIMASQSDSMTRDYSQIVKDLVDWGRFPLGVTNGLIILIPKTGACKQFRNCCSITLLNIAYKIYGKFLQLRLQGPLPSIISPDQNTFLENWFMLDNIFMTHMRCFYWPSSGSMTPYS